MASATAEILFPSPSVEGTGMGETLAQASFTRPSGTVSGYTGAVGAITRPAPSVDGERVPGYTAQATITRPAPGLSGNTGAVGSMARPAPELRGEVLTGGVATGYIIRPRPALSGTCRNGFEVFAGITRPTPAVFGNALVGGVAVGAPTLRIHKGVITGAAYSGLNIEAGIFGNLPVMVTGQGASLITAEGEMLRPTPDFLGTANLHNSYSSAYLIHYRGL